MAIKLAIFSCFIAFVHGSRLSEVDGSVPAGPYARAYGVPVAIKTEDCDPLPVYKFGYDVADTLTGDYKSQIEQREGDSVQGQYSLVESDGTLRIVEYTADSVHGFNAIVRNEPLVTSVVEPTVVPTSIAAAPLVAQPVVTSKPLWTRYATVNPLAASAPISPRYEYAPAGLVSAPVVAAQYGAPVAATYSASTPYTTPVANQYITRVATPFTAAVAAPYTAPVAAAYPAAAYAAQYAAYNTPVSSRYTDFLTGPISASSTRTFQATLTPAAVTRGPVTSAKLVESATGCQ